MFVPLVSFAQTKIGFKAQNYLNARNNSSSQSISCDDLIKKIKIDGRKLDTSFGGLYSEAIDKIRWYEWEDILFALVTFKSKSNKEYVYGGWKYNFNSYYDLKNAFEKSESKGAAFNEYIRQATIDCSSKSTSSNYIPNTNSSSDSYQPSTASYGGGLSIIRLSDRVSKSGIAIGYMNNRLSPEDSNKYDNYGIDFISNGSVQLDVYLRKTIIGFKYSFGETSFTNERTTSFGLYANDVSTESFWLSIGRELTNNLFAKLAVGSRNDDFDEYLGNGNQYSELDFSLGFTYPIRISWFGLVPEIYYTKTGYLGYGLSLMF